MLKANKPTVFSRGIKTIYKDLKFSNSARLAVLNGASKLHDAVSVTLGPKGRTVLMEQKYNFPKITKDGYTIAQELSFVDKYENMGAQLLKDVTSKSNLESGDGTTTSTVLAYNILKNAIQNVATGANPTEVRIGIQAAIDEVIKFLESNKKQISSNEELKQIAIISSNGDTELGEIIAKAVNEVGKDGIISVENGHKVVDELEIKKGLRFNEGFIKPAFGNISSEKAKVTLENPLILLHKGELRDAQHILPALSFAQQSSRPLLIVTEAMEGDALAIALLNKLRNQVHVVVVKAPGFGDARTEYLEDFSAATGATVLDPQVGEIASAASKELFGSSASAVIASKETVIIEGAGSKENVDSRIEAIRTKLEQKDIRIGERDSLKERLAKLTSGAAVIKVGGVSQFIVKEKKDRLDDALGATHSALQTGFLPGGGVALLKASEHLKSIKFDSLSFDAKLGISIVQSALTSPFDKILSNSGIEHGHIKSKLLDSFSKGVNAQTGEIVDMYEAGIVDPMGSVKGALLNSAGVTSLLSSAEVAITNVLGEKEGF